MKKKTKMYSYENKKKRRNIIFCSYEFYKKGIFKSYELKILEIK